MSAQMDDQTQRTRDFQEAKEKKFSTTNPKGSPSKPKKKGALRRIMHWPSKPNSDSLEANGPNSPSNDSRTELPAEANSPSNDINNEFETLISNLLTPNAPHSGNINITSNYEQTNTAAMFTAKSDEALSTSIHAPNVPPKDWNKPFDVNPAGVSVAQKGVPNDQGPPGVPEKKLPKPTTTTPVVLSVPPALKKDALVSVLTACHTVG
ncbi:hypothetical protein M413DRAFT_115980 [Hebeloma cylindrosporum]|uniref:Uncharacterized protein n=1 Tax=Hebeloma cylindrosporum TaxID=76867 RepID=A0A0C3D0Y3_HEBCY|nr:hypothetical protein M413DRAFT_115980 [Hebeloma cylindrosporum h7]